MVDETPGVAFLSAGRMPMHDHHLRSKVRASQRWVCRYWHRSLFLRAFLFGARVRGKIHSVVAAAACQASFMANLHTSAARGRPACRISRKDRGSHTCRARTEDTHVAYGDQALFDGHHGCRPRGAFELVGWPCCTPVRTQALLQMLRSPSF